MTVGPSTRRASAARSARASPARWRPAERRRARSPGRLRPRCRARGTVRSRASWRSRRRPGQHDDGLRGQRERSRLPPRAPRRRAAAAPGAGRRGGGAVRPSRARRLRTGSTSTGASRSRRQRRASAWQRGHSARWASTGAASAASSVPLTNQGSSACTVVVLVAVERQDARLHSQSSSSPRSSARRRRRPWNMRVFTVSTGQSTMSRDLGVRQVVEIGQDEHAALLGREAVERAQQGRTDLRGAAPLLRSRLVGRRLVVAGSSTRLVVAAQRLQSRAVGDREDPGRHLARRRCTWRRGLQTTSIVSLSTSSTTVAAMSSGRGSGRGAGGRRGRAPRRPRRSPAATRSTSATSDASALRLGAGAACPRTGNVRNKATPIRRLIPIAATRFIEPLGSARTTTARPLLNMSENGESRGWR